MARFSVKPPESSLTPETEYYIVIRPTSNPAGIAFILEDKDTGCEITIVTIDEKKRVIYSDKLAREYGFIMQSFCEAEVEEIPTVDWNVQL